MEEQVYEMLWDCGYCNAKKLRAFSQKFCPACGAAQDPKARYFPSDADKVEAAEHRYEGVDKVCSACQAPNGAAAEFCGACGAPLDKAAQVATVSDEIRAAESRFEASLSRRQLDANQRRQTPVAAAVEQPAKAGTKRLTWLIGLVLLVLALVALFSWSRVETVTVTGHYWRQTIQVERFGPVRESTWCSAMPVGAYGVSSYSDVRGYRQVPAGQECFVRRVDRGNGTYAERQECRPRYHDEPVYDQRCDYSIDRWTPSRTAAADGSDLNPRWPATGVTGGITCRGCEREGARASVYQVIFRGGAKGDEYRCEFNQDRWRTIREGSSWSLPVGVVGGDARCDGLKPAG